MKNLTIVILLVTTLALAGLYSFQLKKTHAARAANAPLSQTVEELQSQVSEQEKQAASLETHLEKTRETALAKADEVAQLQQVLTNQAETGAKAANPLAEMFKSPEMKDFIKNQQKTVVGTLLEKNYAALIASLQLTPDQAETLKDLLMKRSMADAETGMAMLAGENDPAKRKELAQQAKTQHQAVDDQIKQFLGDANYTQFQAYEKTLPERMTLNSFKDQQASGPGALTPAQEEQLIQVMGDERQSFKFTTDLNDKSKLEGDLSTVFSEEKINQFQSELEQLNKQYLARAQNILSSDQLTAFEKFLNGQRELQAVGMKMASKMFGTKTGNN